jgi:predicted CopG family antitoxin
MSKTTIILEKATRERLRQLGIKGQSYDDVINRLIDKKKGLPDRRTELQSGKPLI